jgi:hypothetical protein
VAQLLDYYMMMISIQAKVWDKNAEIDRGDFHILNYHLILRCVVYAADSG